MLAAKLLPLLLITTAAPAQDGGEQLLLRLDEAAAALVELGHGDLADQVEQVARSERRLRPLDGDRQELEDELVRMGAALRAYGLDAQAERLERQRERPGQHPAAEHLALARAAGALAQVDPDSHWSEAARGHALLSVQAGREESHRREARELELLRLVESAVQPGHQEQLVQAMEWREKRVAEGRGPKRNDSADLIRLYDLAAVRLAFRGDEEESQLLEGAARTLARGLRRDEERKAARGERRAESYELRDQRRGALDGSADYDQALRDAVVQALGSASQTLARAGEQRQSVMARGAQRALRRRAFEASGAPAREEVRQHLRAGATYERNQRRAAWLRELAGRVQTAAPAAADPLLQRLELLEQELSALRAELEKR